MRCNPKEKKTKKNVTEYLYIYRADFATRRAAARAVLCERDDLLLSTAQLLGVWSSWRQRNRVEGLTAAVGSGSVMRRHLVNTSVVLTLYAVTDVRTL